ncbi:uncharacterized protein LOC111280048 isoform X2 [Durio zibethinus]|uniref:Uncharacterized protein LOC111280048 isoform X2 n=1 Tax=Durio zibethinus TaxID=66656 RepID=A0A6P5X5K0_DURZI|nr:uncharacterized protein LOC111280048 isoform X2 [Durio zibethinus]
MAVAVSLVSPIFSFVPKFSLKPLLFSPLSTPSPSKTTKRKNYLRLKILKTLTKPFPSSSPINPIAPLQSPPETKPLDVVVFEPPSDEMPNQVLEETSKVEEFRASETWDVAGEISGSFGKFSAYSALKFGFYFVGIFVFQTLIAVWVMGNGNSQDKDGNLDDFQRNNESKNGKFLTYEKVGSVSRNVLYCDESELEEKVEEIRAMAREARNKEKKEMKNSDEEGDVIDESLTSKARIGIEKEIGARLNRLEKKLNSKRENFPGSYMSFLDKLKDSEDAQEMNKALSTRELNKALFIKKKFKFRAPEKNSRSDVKGFGSLKNGKASSNKNAIATNGSEAKEVVDGKRVPSRNSDSLPSNREKTEKIEEFGALRNNTSAGSESSQEMLSTEVMKSRKSRDLDTQNSQVFTKENQEARTKSDKHAFLHTSKSRDVCNKPPANKVKDNQPGIKTDPWWLNLPYVLAILMQRGIDPDGPGGLFTLRISSAGQEQRETSCTVAFQDHIDANNFCYLLESYFEDLGDFSAEVVPMSVKNL